jgi:hypothetical protein
LLDYLPPIELHADILQFKLVSSILLLSDLHSENFGIYSSEIFKRFIISDFSPPSNETIEKADFISDNFRCFQDLFLDELFDFNNSLITSIPLKINVQNKLNYLQSTFTQPSANIFSGIHYEKPNFFYDTFAQNSVLPSIEFFTDSIIFNESGGFFSFEEIVDLTLHDFQFFRIPFARFSFS